MTKVLKQNVGKTVGIITEDLTIFSCAEIVDGINEILDDRDYSYLFENLRLYKKYDINFYQKGNYKKQIEAALHSMLENQVDGIIYISAHCRKIHYIPEEFPIPLVAAYTYTDDHNVPSIVFDDEEAAYQATMALIKNGNTKIGVITGEMSSLHTKERLKGYRRALKDAGLPYEKALVQEGDWTKAKSIQACRTLMNESVTGIFVMSDVMAAGVYEFTASEEIRVGTDLDVIGFDNREIATAFNPPLSTMALPLSQIGHKAAEVMINILENGETPSKDSLYKINCNLIVRESLHETY